MSKFEEVSLKIVKDNILSVISIDDEFVEPFENEPAAHKEKTKKLYNSFKENGSLMEIYRYENADGLSKIENALRNKDLLILDWEITKIEPKFARSLEILEKAVNTDNIHFVCIYTHRTDLDSAVIPNIYAYFTGKSADDINRKNQLFIDAIEGYMKDYKAFIDIMCKELYPLTLSVDPRKDLRGEFQNVLKRFGVEGKKISELFKELKEIFEEQSIEEIIKLICLKGKNCNFSSAAHDSIPVSTIDSVKNALFVGNTLVTLTSKTVEPEELFGNIANTIVQRPGNIFSLIGLEIRAKYKKCALALGKDVNDIDELAFVKFYAKDEKTKAEDYENEKEDICEQIKGVWREELTSGFREQDIELFDVLDEYIEERGKIKELDEYKDKNMLNEKLVRLNSSFSMVNVKRNNQRIRFGDILVVEGEGPDNPFRYKYVICITAHCDCLRPGSKIDNNFYFAGGRQVPHKSALENADGGYYSFVSAGGKAVCIEWDQKLISLYIESGKNDIRNEIVSTYNRKDIKLKHICLQKENYTQRIANKAAGNVTRVGVTYSKIDSTDGGYAKLIEDIYGDFDIELDKRMGELTGAFDQASATRLEKSVCDLKGSILAKLEERMCLKKKDND